MAGRQADGGRGREMNSQTIRERFGNLYRAFYSKCHTVCSAPTCFFWAGDSLVQYGIPALVQKLPLRVYVGFESSDEPGLNWGTFQTYDQRKGLFIDFDCLQPAMQRVTNWLNSMQRQSFPYLPAGVKIHGLSELAWGAPHAGTGTGALMASLAACLTLHGLRFKAEQVSDACQNRGSLFEALFRLGWKLHLELEGGYSLWNGADVFCALVPSAYPVFYISEPRFMAADHCADVDTTLYSSGYDDIKRAGYCGLTVADIAESGPPWHWPFDFGLLDTGLPKGSMDAASANVTLHLKMEDFAKWCQLKVAPFLLDDQRLPISPTYVSGSSTKVWHKQIKPAEIWSLYMLFSIVNMFDRGFHEDRIRSFVDAVNSYHHHLQSLGLCDAEIDDIRNLFIKVTPRFLRGRVGIKLSGAGKGGGLVFVSPSGALRDLLEPLMERLESEGWHSARVEYASWLDGYENSGLRVEQCAREHLFNAALGQEHAVAVIWDGVGKTTTRLISEQDIPQLIESYDVVAFNKEKAIYVAGERLRGKDGLHSATYSTKLLYSLLSNPRLRLTSRQMPKGYCYSSERWELQGKIVGPLKRVIQQRTGKQLHLEVLVVQGRLQLQLSPSALTICAVRS